MRLLLCKFFAAPDSNSGGVVTTNLDDKNLNKDDIYDLLGDETPEDTIEIEEKPAKPEKENEDEEKNTPEAEEEEDDLKELEEELEEPDEEKLELTTPVRRREILAKYPNLFKDFPYLEKAYYREQQFTEIYPTIDDAKDAQSKAETLDQYESHLMQGSVESILKAIKAEDENAFFRLADNYLGALWNTDKMAYHHVVGNINKMTIAYMVQEGKKLQNDGLIQAAHILNQFVFGKGEWEPPTNLAQNQQQDPQLNQDRIQFNQQRFESARDDLQVRLSNALTATIEQHIDKQNSMTSYVKKAACNDAMGHLQRLINGDKRFQAIKDKLWQRAAQENFSKESVDRIRSAFTTRAKTLLPTVIKKARAEALKGLGKRARDEDDTEDRNDGSTRTQKSRNTTSSNRSSGRSYSERAKEIPKGMSTLDYLNKD